MGLRRLRLGIRAQLTLTLLLGALLSTGATLFIANNAIQQYALQQTHTQEQQDMKIALLVLQTQYGQNISISSDNQLVADSPTTGKDLSSYNSPSADFGRFALNNDQDYVDQVQQLLGGFVSVYQCANPNGPTGTCKRISTTLQTNTANSTGARTRLVGSALEQAPTQNMALSSANPQEWLGVVTLAGKQYYSDYYPLMNPQQRMQGAPGIERITWPLTRNPCLPRSCTSMPISM